MPKRLFYILILALLLPLVSLAQELSFTVCPDLIRPGKTERISFTVPAAGEIRLEVCDGSGNSVAIIRENMTAAEGTNHLTWDGLNAKGEPLPAGEYYFSLQMSGEKLNQPFSIGAESPQILAFSALEEIYTGDVWHLTIETNMAGTLTLRVRLADGEWHTFLEESAPAGESTHAWDGIVEGERIPGGSYAVQLKLTDETGFSGTTQQLFLDVAVPVTPSPVPTATPAPTPHIVVPSAVTTKEEEGLNYWTLPMGEMDEEAIWEVMMQPMVIIDGDQKTQYLLRKEPNDSTKRSNVVGEITRASQGVHVLETLDNGWSLVEAYNSSYGDTYNKKGHHGFGNTDDLIRGYIKTSALKTVEPRTDYGLLIDKLEQKMYIFSEGKCIGTLLISTGLNNSQQAWNETPAGEFFMISRAGGFAAGNLYCAYGMRVNDGTLIHEVPYIGTEKTPVSERDYSIEAAKLGKKASHGCIRVQRATNEQGQNIKWLWDNIKLYTKVLIWDDTGRYLTYPDDATPLYYNPNGGKNYHEDQYCSGVKERYLPLTEFSYAELDSGIYADLTPCKTCARIMRKSEIDAINKENGF